MNPQVAQGLSKIIYSVIEKGICRIVTSQHGYLLNELKTAYSENIPENHRLIWLPGNISSLDELSQVLVKAGVLEAYPGFERQQQLQKIKEHLILCNQQHILEIWVFENAEHLPTEVIELMAELISWKYLDHTLFTFELWGNAQLDALYHSQSLKICCAGQHYYIPVGQAILVKDRSANVRVSLMSGFSILALGIVLGISVSHLPSEKFSQILGGYFNKNVNDLATNLTIEPARQDSGLSLKSDDHSFANISPGIGLVSTSTIKQQTDIETESVNHEQSLIQSSVNVMPVESVATIQIKQQQAEAASDLSLPQDITPFNILSDATNNGPSAHWYFSLDFPAWREKYQINLADNIDRSDGLFYLQLGLYKKQGSLDDFFPSSLLSKPTFHVCYIQQSNLVALLTGMYPSARVAYNASINLASEGYSSSVVGVNEIKQWQCHPEQFERDQNF